MNSSLRKKMPFLSYSKLSSLWKNKQLEFALRESHMFHSVQEMISYGKSQIWDIQFPIIQHGSKKEYCRFYSSSNESSLNVFDRKTKRKQRDWAAVQKNGKIYDYIKDEIGNRVADRVYDITRKFDVGVELGCGKGHVAKHLTNENVGTLYLCDISEKMLEVTELPENISTKKLVVDEEQLPFDKNSIDIFISSLNFHWINDLPAAFRQIHSALKPDGVLIASMFGGDTLFELRSSLQLAEIEREGGFAPHISPFTMIRDVGDLLNRAGFKMLTIDVDELNICYPTMFELLWDLQGMAESNASWNRKLHLNRDTLLAAAAIYEKMYGNKDGTIPATFQIIYLIGWKAHKSQAEPARRGSGTVSFKDLSNSTAEKKKGET